MNTASEINANALKNVNGAKVVIIGAVAGGAAVAARLIRLNNKLNVTLLEKASNVSIASCGMPYFVGGEIQHREDLLVHTPASLEKAMGVTRVLVNTEAIKIDRKRKVVVAKRIGLEAEIAAPSADSTTGDENKKNTIEFPYDFLVMATGSSPIVPPIKGLVAPASSPSALPDPLIQERVLTLRNLADMDKIVRIVGSAENNKNKKKDAARPPQQQQQQPLQVTVVGAGFIGIEMVEQLHKLGHKVTLVERNPTVLPICDDEIGAMLHPILRKNHVNLITNDSVVKIAAKTAAAAAGDAQAPPLTLTTANGKLIPSHLVVLCVGVRPETALAKSCGLRLSGGGAGPAPTTTTLATNGSGEKKPQPPSGPPSRDLIVVDDYMRTSDPFIYAVGDAVEVSDGVFRDKKSWTPLATVAAIEARICADHIVLGKSIPFRGSFSTAIVRCFGAAVAVTGWSEKRLRQATTANASTTSGGGIPYAVSVINGWTTASYYPGAKAALIKILYCPTTGRLFGGQCVGAADGGVDKRVDIIATALLGNLTIHELSHAQFAYSPPFNSAKDPVTVACLNGRNISFDRLVSASTRLDPKAVQIDVRPQGAFEKDPITSAVPNQPKRHLFWMTAKANAKKLLEDEKKNSSSSTAAAAPKKFQSLCFWGRTSYFAHRQMLQEGFTQSNLTTLQGGNAYAQALKEAELSGSKL